MMDNTNVARKRISNDCNLCEQVQKKLDLDCICQPLRNERIETNGNLNEAIQRNFKCRIIVENVVKFLESKTIDDSYIPLPKKSYKEFNVSSDPLYLNLIKKYLPPESKSGIELFGINEDFFNRVLKSKEKSESEKEELNKFVEKKIDDFCMKILEYSGNAHKYRNNWKRAFRESMKDLSSECDRLALCDLEIQSNQAAIDDMLLMYYEDLIDGVTMLKKIVSLYEKKLDFELSLGTLYVAKYSTFSLKIRRLESEIKNATYTKKTVLALKIISKQLDERRAKLEEVLDDTNCDLQAYYMLGTQYEDLVKEYTDLIKRIQEEQWAIETLKLKQSSSECISEDTSKVVPQEVATGILINLEN